MAEKKWISLNFLELSMKCANKLISVGKDEMMLILEDMYEGLDAI